MALVKYQYSGNTAPVVNLPGLVPLGGDFNSNPFFNFDQAFLDGLHSIKPTDMGMSLPHISLKILDPNGTVVENLNLAFFQQAFDSAQISTDRRYSERPVMSLRDITLKTNLASGYLYYNNVIMNIRVHRPESLGSTFLIALLFPGMPFLLEYGWNSPDPLLDQKDLLLFAVKTYTLRMDASGQIDIMIEGTAFNERFNNILVGDTGQLTLNNEKMTVAELDGLGNYKTQLQTYSGYLKDMSRRSDSTINDYSILPKLAETYKSVELRSRGAVSNAFSIAKNSLKNVVTKQDFGPTLRQRDVVKFHDLLYTLCHDTFDALGKIITHIDEFRVIYGNFNAKAGTFANKSLAEFPIDLKMFNALMQANFDKGIFVPTIERLLNDLHVEFFENEEYWKSNLTPNVANNPDFQPDVFQMPDVVSHFITRSQKDPNNPQNMITVMELYIIDINSGKPITTQQLAAIQRGSQDEAEQAVAGSTNFPIIRLGHANSFIKNLSLDQISDQNMKAALIERMVKSRVTSPRDTVTNEASLGAKATTPLVLPLRGTAEVVGHPAWKPFRAFYLSSGLFLVDGIYKITSVSHTLGAGVYNTNIEFMWH